MPTLSPESDRPVLTDQTKAPDSRHLDEKAPDSRHERLQVSGTKAPNTQRGLLRIAGVTLGLAASTIAVVTRRTNGTTVTSSQTFTTRGRRGATTDEHRDRIAEQADTVDRAIGPVVLVVIEGLTVTAKDDDRALHRATLGRLRARAVPVAVFKPGTRIPGGDRAEHAMHLAHLGAVRLGWDVPTRSDPDAATALNLSARPVEDQDTCTDCEPDRRVAGSPAHRSGWAAALPAPSLRAPNG